MSDLNPRTQAALERISEDETLYSDVTDDTAATILEWLTTQITAADAQDDAIFEQTMTTLRRTARSAARASNDNAGQFLALAQPAAVSIAAAPPSNAQAVSFRAAPAAPTVVAQASAASASAAPATDLAVTPREVETAIPAQDVAPTVAVAVVDAPATPVAAKPAASAQTVEATADAPTADAPVAADVAEPAALPQPAAPPAKAPLLPSNTATTLAVSAVQRPASLPHRFPAVGRRRGGRRR